MVQKESVSAGNAFHDLSELIKFEMQDVEAFQDAMNMKKFYES
jgi:hypothetical protein